MTPIRALVIGVVLVGLLVFVSATANAMNERARTDNLSIEGKAAEGQVESLTVIAGPFDITRRYESMRGPFLNFQFRVADLVATKTLTLPESKVKFLSGRPDDAPSMATQIMSRQLDRPVGLIDATHQLRELLWFKGLKVEVLDEHDNPMPTAEFFCHLNLFVDQNLRNSQAFRGSEPVSNSMMGVLTQGQTSFSFPKGFAVPVASDEEWALSMQAANRTTDRHRRIKHRVTLYFIKDRNLVEPVKALHWYHPYIGVLLDKKNKDDLSAGKQPHVSDCGLTCGLTAPNSLPNSVYRDLRGRKVCAHFAVPTGTHSFHMPLAVAPGMEGFASRDRLLHAAWVHVHPLCTSMSLVDASSRNRRKIFTSRVTTDTSKGLELKHIGSLSSPSGILLAKGRNYEIEATYVNNTGKIHDSMVSTGLFFEDYKFKRPGWANSVIKQAEGPAVKSASITR